MTQGLAVLEHPLLTKMWKKLKRFPIEKSDVGNYVRNCMGHYMGSYMGNYAGNYIGNSMGNCIVI